MSSQNQQLPTVTRSLLNFRNCFKCDNHGLGTVPGTTSLLLVRYLVPGTCTWYDT